MKMKPLATTTNIKFKFNKNKNTCIQLLKRVCE